MNLMMMNEVPTDTSVEKRGNFIFILGIVLAVVLSIGMAFGLYAFVCSRVKIGTNGESLEGASEKYFYFRDENVTNTGYNRL